VGDGGEDMDKRSKVAATAVLGLAMIGCSEAVLAEEITGTGSPADGPSDQNEPDSNSGTVGSSGSPIEGLLTSGASTPSQFSVATVIENICPQGIASADLQRDCDALVGASSEDDPESSAALGSVTASAAGVPTSASLNRTATAQDAVQSRINAIRGGLTGFLINLSGNPGATGGGASADPYTGRLSGFLIGGYRSLEKDNSLLEPGFDTDSWSINLGVDYRLRSDLVLGGSLSYASTSTDFSNNGGKLDSDSYNLLFYGTYYPSDQLYFDGLLGIGQNDYDQKRNIKYQLVSQGTRVNQQALASYDGKQHFAYLGTGYDFNAGALTYGPTAQLSYSKINVDGYTEEMGNLDAEGSGWGVAIDDQDFKSVTFSLGAKMIYAVSHSWGVLSPQVDLNWIHEFEDDPAIVNGFFVGDPSRSSFNITREGADSDYGTFGFGATAVFKDGTSAFVYLDTLFGYRDLTSYQINLGIRKEF